MNKKIEPAKEISPADLAIHMGVLRQTVGWQILLNYMSEEREKIITEGKKARSFDKSCNLWKIIEGFDRCAELPEKLENFGRRNSELDENQGEE